MVCEHSALWGTCFCGKKRGVPASVHTRMCTAHGTHSHRAHAHATLTHTPRTHTRTPLTHAHTHTRTHSLTHRTHSLTAHTTHAAHPRSHHTTRVPLVVLLVRLVIRRVDHLHTTRTHHTHTSQRAQLANITSNITSNIASNITSNQHAGQDSTHETAQHTRTTRVLFGNHLRGRTTRRNAQRSETRSAEGGGRGGRGRE